MCMFGFKLETKGKSGNFGPNFWAVAVHGRGRKGREISMEKKMERVAEWVRKTQPRNQRDFWCVHGRPWVVQEIGEKILRFLGCRGLGFGCKKSPSLVKNFGAIWRARAEWYGSQKRGRVWFANPNPSLGLAKVKTPSNPSIFPCKINGIFMCMFVCAWLKIGTPFGGENPDLLAAKGGGEKLEPRLKTNFQTLGKP